MRETVAERPAVSDHYESAGDDDTVYRVVGVGDDRVTLLRLTDSAGNRKATGELRYVGRDDLDREFAVADDPDPRWGWPDYLGALFVAGGLGILALTQTELLSGAAMVLGGAYILWRRQSWRR